MKINLISGVFRLIGMLMQKKVYHLLEGKWEKVTATFMEYTAGN
jgi:hypothetical protein